jgi:hypothetical protein
MTPTEFAIFKYQYADRAELSASRRRLMFVGLGLTALARAAQSDR